MQVSETFYCSWFNKRLVIEILHNHIPQYKGIFYDKHTEGTHT